MAANYIVFLQNIRYCGIRDRQNKFRKFRHCEKLSLISVWDIYENLIGKRKQDRIKCFKNQDAFFEFLSVMNDVHENVVDYSSRKSRKT